MTERTGQIRSPLTTRDRLLRAAEQLFYERGIDAVSNRQISETAGQANNYAVGYHFGTREGLLRALLSAHNNKIDAIRRRMVDEITPATGTARDWLCCLLQPQLEYLGSQQGPTYFAQFCSQMESNPATVGMLYEQAENSQPLREILAGLETTLPELPDEVVDVRNLMTRNLLVTTVADFERQRNESDPSDTESWKTFARAIVDAMVGIWTAEVSRR